MSKKVLKKYKYIENLQKAIASDANHPYHAGFKMQAHHILSRDAFFRIDNGKGAYAKKIELLDYNINMAENLVFLPCELEGACHLQVPLHRGNHTYVNQNAKDKDIDRPYHDTVADMIEDRTQELVKECKTNCSSKNNQANSAIQEELDDLSEDVLDMIDSYELALTSMHDDFKLLNPKGCGNLKNVGKSSTNCTNDRDHRPELKHRETGSKIDFLSVAENNNNAIYKLKIYKTPSIAKWP